MCELRIFDLNVPLPEDTRITANPTEEMRLFYAVDGATVCRLKTALETEALSRGYRIRYAKDISYLARGERQIKIHQLKPTRLGITVDDAEALPRAQTLQGSIGLSKLILPVPGSARVKPGRERHEPGSNTWSAEWRIYECNAGDIATLMHDALLQSGFRSGGIWQPPKGGIPRWKVEAYTAHVLIQVGIVETDDHLCVDVSLIGDATRSD